MNEALKVKAKWWLWWFSKEENSLWKNMMKMTCDVDKFGWWNKKSPYPHGVGC